MLTNPNLRIVFVSSSMQCVDTIGARRAGVQYSAPAPCCVDTSAVLGSLQSGVTVLVTAQLAQSLYPLYRARYTLVAAAGGYGWWCHCLWWQHQRLSLQPATYCRFNFLFIAELILPINQMFRRTQDGAQWEVYIQLDIRYYLLRAVLNSVCCLMTEVTLLLENFYPASH